MPGDGARAVDVDLGDLQPPTRRKKKQKIQYFTAMTLGDPKP